MRRQFRTIDVLGDLLRRKAVSPVIAAFAALVGVALALAASTVVSNILVLGPTALSIESVTLSAVKTLPSSMKADSNGETRFQITNQGVALGNATLKLRVVASNAFLSDPSLATVVFKDPVSGADVPVPLTAVNGKLEGTLKSGWSIPQGYTGIVDLKVTFKKSAPVASYSLEVWVENDSDTGAAGTGNSQQTSQTGTPQTYNVQATDGDVFSPSTVTIKVGDTVKWTNISSKPHNVVFSNSSIPGINFLTSQQTYQVTFSNPGTFSYVCAFHSGMGGTVTVQ